MGSQAPSKPVVLAFVGKSNSGKTTVIEKLIPILKGRGYKIGTLKHVAHEFEIDHEGKDTWRHRQAGSDIVAIASHTRFALIASGCETQTPNVIISNHMQACDLVIVEGYKEQELPKILVVNPQNPVIVCGVADGVRATISTTPIFQDVPNFERDATLDLAEWIIHEFLGAIDSVDKASPGKSSDPDRLGVRRSS